MFQNVSNDSVLGYAQLQEQRVNILHIEDSPGERSSEKSGRTRDRIGRTEQEESGYPQQGQDP